MDKAELQRMMVSAQAHGAQTAIFVELVGLLIKTGVLNQAQVVAAYERLSVDLMGLPGGAQGVQLADLVRDFAAGSDRLPS